MPTPFPRVTIPNTEVRMVSSSNVGQEYEILVALPYGHTDADRSYPVLYVLDANWTFGLITDTIRLLQLGDELPEMVIVGDYFIDPILQCRGNYQTIDSSRLRPANALVFPHYIQNR